MCQLGQGLCSSDADCVAPGDSCGAPTSRATIAKRTLASVVSDNSNIVNFGMMTFYQSQYFPYYELDSSVERTETVFLSKGHLEGPCWSHQGGPTPTCVVDSVTYTRVSGNDSRYRTRGGNNNRSEHDVPWCGQFCQIPGYGTSRYLGSYYQKRLVSGGTVSSRKTVFNSYSGKNIVSGGRSYRYYDSRPDYYNGGATPPISVADCDRACSASCGARWDTQLAPFLRSDPTEAQVLEMKQKLLAWMEPASLGGLITYGGTPSGCTLENNVAQSSATSAYHYMSAVKTSDTLPCRQNYVLFVTDGEANGPGDSNCSATACGESNPEVAGCTCRAVLAAYRMRQNLGVKTFVVGFSSDVATGTARIVNDNVARAGGTDVGNDGVEPFAFVATNETELQAAIQGAIYDAVRGTYSTAPSTSSSGRQQSTSIAAGKFALDARVDFPSWKGHLLAYDVSVNPPVLAWDAAEEVARTDWWLRNVYLGTHEGNVIKVLVESSPPHRIVNRDLIFGLGIGVNADEAESILKFTMGDPSSGNPAPLGAMVNSTPIDVAEPGDSPMPGGHAFFTENRGRIPLTYVGASDGMLHAFYTESATIGGELKSAGSEAFAYIPPSMFQVVSSIYVQGGQLADPRQHIFGLANSPKVKNLCIANCDDAQMAVWKTLLVMGAGYGGSGLFMLDITNPVGPAGLAEPPVRPLWHSTAPNLSSSYEPIMGNAVSVPAFHFNKTGALDDYRLVFASGYPVEPGSLVQGRRLVVASASSGVVLNAAALSPANSCAQPYAALADVATARDYAVEAYQKFRAGYVGDTWGNLWRYAGSSVRLLKSFGCSYPLHFAPTVVQLDRDDPANSRGLSYLVQVTNSALDKETTRFPASRMTIIREMLDANGDVVTDSGFGTNGELTLTAGVDNEICGVTNPDGSCAESLPANARPTTTPMAILKRDGSGFQTLSMWYAPDAVGCTKGVTWLAIHQVIGGSVTQIQGLKVADEPVTSPVIAGGRIFVVGSRGAIEITGDISASYSAGSSTPVSNVGVGVFQQLSWTEIE
jgi:Neisseria PilC beta-propeller domain